MAKDAAACVMAGPAYFAGRLDHLKPVKYGRSQWPDSSGLCAPLTPDGFSGKGDRPRWPAFTGWQSNLPASLHLNMYDLIAANRDIPTAWHIAENAAA